PDGAGRRAHRSAQNHGRQTTATRLSTLRRTVPRLPPAHRGGPSPGKIRRCIGQSGRVRRMNDWQDLVELERLALWMDSKGLESGSIEAPLRLAGGTQNLLLRFRR